MGRLLKWVVLGILILSVLALIGAGLAFFIFTGSVQPTSGRLKLENLSGPVSVVRDKHGIPHITAEKRTDAVTALGFVHAQDRLWQMELLRRTGQGRLSEIFGSETLDLDVFLRTLGFQEQVAPSFGSFNSETQQLLRAYTDGINAYLTQPTSTTHSVLPPEFLILGHKPEPWKPEDSLLVLKLMSLQLSMNLKREIERLTLAAQGLNSAEIEDIMPYNATDNPPPLPDLRKLFDLKPLITSKLSSNTRTAFHQSWLKDAGQWASNNWVLSGSRTVTGKPLLANDPHLAFGAPGLWYLAHLSWVDEKSERVNEIGATLPAMPGVLLGNNGHVAWGFTNSGGDAQDLFIEQVRGTPPKEYLTPDGWKPLSIAESIIKVKGAPDHVFRKMVGRHGPLLPRSYKKLGEMLSANDWAALQWTGLSKEDKGLEYVLELAKTRTVSDFGKPVSGIIAPMQTIVVADKQGAIGLFAPAKLPMRKLENAMMGRAPVPGWFSEYDWEGTVPIERMPKEINPLTGVLFSANSQFVENNSDPFLTWDWASSFRHERVKKLIAEKNGPQSLDDMMVAQNDTYSPGLIKLREILFPFLDKRHRETALFSDLKKWNGIMEVDRPEPLFMTALHRQILFNVFEDDIGSAMKTAFPKSVLNLERVFKQGGARDWCDDRKTAGKTETCYDIVARSYDAAFKELSENYGSAYKSWKWGDAHYMYGEHKPFGKVWPLSMIFDIKRPMPGDHFSISRGRSDFDDKKYPYRSVHGAGFRAVYDLGNLDNSQMIMSTGQSGNAFSDQYDDLTDLWKDGRYVSMTTKREEYSKGALGTWMLMP